MVFLAKRMLDLQEQFLYKNLPGVIDIGYHYTDERNLEHIRTNGLLTKSDREEKKVEAKPKGVSYLWNSTSSVIFNCN